MKYSLVILADARKDIDDLAHYLENNFGYDIRNKAISKLFDQLDWLGRFPNSGKKLQTIIVGISVDGFYYLRTSKVTILYDIDFSKKKVSIGRILDNRQNILKILHEYFE